MKLFIVDDSAVGRDIIKKSMANYGYTDIEEAKDGVEALEILEKTKPNIDLFILDVNMPRMDGLTLLGKLKTLYPSTPIVMLTTETDKEKMVKAKELGATGWIVKPFDAEKLVKVIQMVVKNK